MADTRNISNIGAEPYTGAVLDIGTALDTKAAMDAKLTACGLSAGYDKKICIDNITFSIKKGEKVALIGPNGAGKSTILKTIVNVLKPDKGAVYLESKSIGDYAAGELAKKVSVLFSHRSHTQYETCLDIVAMGRLPYTGHMGFLSEKDREIAHETMKLCGIEELSEREFSKLSDGQCQRVMLARAICQTPELLILDEPTAFLDIRYKLKLFDILKALTDTTVIMSIHETDLAAKLSDKVLCIKEGHLLSFGRPEEILNREMIKALYDIDDKGYEIIFG